MALTVVTGPPAAGKTTYVNAHARPGDIVIDYDRIAEALTTPGASTHDHGRNLKRVAYAARHAAVIEAIHLADRTDVWIIHTNPTPDTMARYEQAGATIIPIDPGRDVVMARIAEQRPAGMERTAQQWYRTHDESSVRVQGSRAW